MIRWMLATLSIVTMTAVAAAAGVTRDITWDSLIPPTPPLEHPLANLTMEQRYDLGGIIMLRQYIEETASSEVTPEAEEIVELTYKLKSEGLNVEELLAKKTAFDAEVDRRNGMVVNDLDGELVRLPGYVLPLEYSESGVKEFLLVPYIGACIHVPPPPPNQMVFVRLEETFSAEGLYRPVWVTGRMSVEDTSSALSYVDGQAPIAASYTLDGIEVEPYE